jgi:hypothetical protein
MVSHLVVIWVTDPTEEKAEIVLNAANRLLKDIPGVHAFHAGLMYPTDRPVVDKTYQVALNMQFDSMDALAVYQSHPQHVDFVENFLKPNLSQLRVYDFEG